MAGQIGIRELKERTSAIVKRIRERNETVIITYRGRAVARIVPFEDASTMRAEGRRPYVIPGGGSNPVGALGYVACASELLGQKDAKHRTVGPRCPGSWPVDVEQPQRNAG